MTTNNAVNSGLSGTTGTGNFVGSNTPSLTTPKIITSALDTNGNTILGITPTASAVNYVDIINNSTGNAPAVSALGSDTNIALSLIGKGNSGVTVQGTSTNSNAASGLVGEYVTSNIPSASAVSISNNTPTNVTSISLTAGDWNIFGNIFFIGTGLTNPLFASWTSTTSATGPDSSLTTQFQAVITLTGLNIGLACPFLRVNIGSTTTVYLTAYSVFSAGSVTACGSIFARRAR